MNWKLYKQAMNHLKIPADMNEKTIEFLQKNQANTIKAKRIYSKKKFTIVIAATLIATIVLMGAGFAMIAIKFFDMDGNSWTGFIPFRQKQTQEQLFSDVELFAKEFIDWGNMEENTFIVTYGDRGSEGFGDRLIIDPYGTIGITYPVQNISNYNELLNYIDGDIIKLPQFIPDGYEFSGATITYFISEDFDYATAELIAREERFGIIFEKYYIPKNPGAIQGILVEYEKPGSGDTHYIGYRVILHDSNYNPSISTPENTISEVLQMPQFARNILLSTNQGAKTQRTFTAINTISIRRGYILLNKELIEAQGNRAKEEYGTVSYNINAYDLSRDEIVKMAESIK